MSLRFEMDLLTTHVVVLCGETPTVSESNARKIAEFLGTKVTILSVRAIYEIETIREFVTPGTALIVHADTLVRIAEVLGTGVGGLLALMDLGAHVFIYGFESTDCHASILRTLSLGGLLGLEMLPAADATFEVANGHREWCGQFSGLSVRAVDPKRDGCFAEGNAHDSQSVLVRAAGRPFLVRVDHGRSDVFFVACGELADLDEKVTCEVGLLPWFPKLIPLMIFLRRVFGNHIWHSDHSQACFIIDDPLLRQRYGFLEYQRLLAVMAQRSFSTSIAFIPWNYRRSRQQVANLFSATPTPFSLCIHGCDHTGGEFATTDIESLRKKTHLAIERMRAHCQLSGIPFDDVMVFPQGLFSAEALTALESSGYLAAVNTDLCPSTMPETLILRDLLDVAVTRFANFPLFGRRYPKDPAEFAFDLFMGKPALAVEHHGYFRNGYGAIDTFVSRLNALDERLEWASLANICSRACLTKTAENGDVHVRFYANRFRLKNTGTQTRQYVLLRQRHLDGRLPSATVDGCEWSCEQHGDSLKLRLSLDPGKTAEIRILLDHSAYATFERKQTLVHDARVLVRRVLSEFRDNHVDTNRVLDGIVSIARSFRSRRKAAHRLEAGRRTSLQVFSVSRKSPSLPNCIGNVASSSGRVDD
jgi:hypothetical protein